MTEHSEDCAAVATGDTDAVRPLGKCDCGLAGLLEELKLLREAEAALRVVANDPHCSYGNAAGIETEYSMGYRIGIADGHRCAAQKARDGLSALDTWRKR